jgi:hypothetical protein
VNPWRDAATVRDRLLIPLVFLVVCRKRLFHNHKLAHNIAAISSLETTRVAATLNFEICKHDSRQCAGQLQLTRTTEHRQPSAEPRMASFCYIQARRQRNPSAPAVSPGPCSTGLVHVSKNMAVARTSTDTHPQCRQKRRLDPVRAGAVNENSKPAAHPALRSECVERSANQRKHKNLAKAQAGWPVPTNAAL